MESETRELAMSARAKRTGDSGVESGNFWDEPLDIYAGGSLNINTYENMIGFTAGEEIAGTVDIQINDPFPAKQLTISFVGVERSHLDASDVLQPLEYHREAKTVIELKSVLATFDESTQLAPGQYTYYFLVKLPPWLPESTILKTERHKFFMEYTLRAQFTPKNSKDYVFDERIHGRYAGVSLFRGSRKVYVYQPYQFPNPVHLNFQIKQTVGGVFGFGSTTVTTQCVLVQNEYYPGDSVIIKIICDNRACKSAVRNFKFKLYRTTRHKHRVSGNFDSTETKIRQVKENGCKAGELLERDFVFNIPMTMEDQSKETQSMISRTSNIDAA